MFDRGDSLLDLISAYRDKEEGSLLDKYANESIHNESSLYGVSPLDYTSGDGVQSAIAENSIQNIFNNRRLNSENLDIFNKLRGIQANRLDMDTESISLAESYADKALDTRTMDGLYNVTLTDVYSSKTRFMAFHGLYTDGMIEQNNSTQLDIETSEHSAAFNQTLIGFYKTLDPFAVIHEPLSHQNTDSGDGFKPSEKIIQMSSITAGILGNISSESSQEKSINNPIQKKHDLVSSVQSVNSFDSSKDVDYIKNKHGDSALTEKAINNEEISPIDKNNSSIYLNKLVLGEPIQSVSSTSPIAVETSLKPIINIEATINNPLSKTIDISSALNSAEKSFLEGTLTDTTDKYHGNYDSKTMRPWVKEREMIINIKTAIESAEDHIVTENISSIILKKENEFFKEEIKKESLVPKRNFDIETKSSELKLMISSDKKIEGSSNISEKILSKEGEIQERLFIKDKLNSFTGESIKERDYVLETTTKNLLDALDSDTSIPIGIVMTSVIQQRPIIKQKKENAQLNTNQKTFAVEKQSIELKGIPSQ